MKEKVMHKLKNKEQKKSKLGCRSMKKKIPIFNESRNIFYTYIPFDSVFFVTYLLRYIDCVVFVVVDVVACSFIKFY
jgi:hypothetical protein